MHKGELIELNAIDVRRFIEDEWDWTDRWLTSNAGYSDTARRISASKGLIR